MRNAENSVFLELKKVSQKGGFRKGGANYLKFIQIKWQE
jgi:hypothetical protein